MSQEYVPSSYAQQEGFFDLSYEDVVGTTVYGQRNPCYDNLDFGDTQYDGNAEILEFDTDFVIDPNNPPLPADSTQRSMVNTPGMDSRYDQQSEGFYGLSYEDVVGTTVYGQRNPRYDNLDFGDTQYDGNVEILEFDTEFVIDRDDPQLPVDNTQWSMVDTPGMDSGYDSTAMFNETPHSMFHSAPEHFGNDASQYNFSADNSFLGQRQNGPSDVGYQPQVDEDQFWEDDEEVPRIQNVSGDNAPQQFPLKFTEEEWENIGNQFGNEDFPEVFVPTNYEVYFDRNVDSPFDTTQTPVDNQQWLAVDIPGADSDNAITSLSRETPHDPGSPAPYQLGNVVDHSSLGNMQEGSGDLNTTANPLTDENHDAHEDGNEDEEDDEDGDEEEDEDENVDVEVNVPHHTTFETYEEHDPLIVETPPPPPKENSKKPPPKWGRTGKRNGQEVWFNPTTSKWQPSASHHDMREVLIRRAQEEHPNDRYLHPDPVDGLAHSETAFFKPHQFRGPDRNDCADSLFELRDLEPSADEQGKRKRKSTTGAPKYINGHPGYMYEDNKILLDPQNNPVVNHNFVPLTLSARTDGSKLQEMALHPDCQHVDLWARMPRWERWTNKDGTNPRIVELRDKNVRINMPMTRFREKKGTIAGGKRDGSENIRAGLLKFYHHHGFDPVASGNSVKAFPRDMEPWEANEVRLGNKAKFGARAGGRALSDKKREDNNQKLLKSIENGKRKQAARGGAGKRPLPDQDDDGDDFNAPNKRVKGFNPSHVGAKGKSGESSRQGRGKKASSSKTQRYGTYGAVQAPHQFPNPTGAYEQSRAPQLSNQYFEGQYQPSHPGIGTGFVPSLNQLQQNALYGGQTWPVQSPYDRSGTLETQHAAGQFNLRQAVLTEPYVPQHILRGMQEQDVLDEAEYNPYMIEENRQRMLRQGMNSVPIGHYIAQSRPWSNLNQQGPFPGYANSGNYGPPLQHPWLSKDTDAAPEPKGNSLGPGGRTVYQAPQQVLGKRVRRDAAEPRQVKKPVPIAPKPVGSTSWVAPNGNQQDGADVQANSAPDVGVSQKRRRNNEIPGTEPMLQRRRRNGRAPLPQYYGAVGGPEPYLPPPPDEVFGTTQPMTGFAGDEEGPLKSSEELSRNRLDIFEVDGDATDQSPAIAGDNDGGNEDTNDAIPNDDQAPQVADTQEPDPPQAPMPAQAEPQVPFDIRDVRPVDGWQSQSLDYALWYTREAYLEWTGQNAPVTNLEDCYNVQYQEIRSAFQDWWISEDNPERLEPMPELWGLEPWDGTVIDWKGPDNVEHLDEAERRGRWAPRNADRSLLRPVAQG